MRQPLIETIPFIISRQQLMEGVRTAAGNPIVEGVLATAEVKNGNGRYYKKDLWEREIDKYMSCVRENRALGELDHPESSIINLEIACSAAYDSIAYAIEMYTKFTPGTEELISTFFFLAFVVVPPGLEPGTYRL